MVEVVPLKKETRMFSQFGRYTDEIFRVVLPQKRNTNPQIAEEDSEVHSPQIYKPKIKELKTQIQKDQIAESGRGRLMQNSKSLPCIQPWEKMLPRSFSQKKTNINSGLLQPKYTQIFKIDALNEDRNKQEELKAKQDQIRQRHKNKYRNRISKQVITLPSENFNKSVSQSHLSCISSEENNIKIPNKGKQVLKFHLMTKRKPLISNSDPNEHRFEVKNYVQPGFKNHLVGRFSLLPKVETSNMSCNISGLVYDFNISKIKARSDRLVPDFDKQLPRDFLQHKGQQDETLQRYYEYDDRFLLKKTKVPIFERILSRDHNKREQLQRRLKTQLSDK